MNKYSGTSMSCFRVVSISGSMYYNDRAWSTNQTILAPIIFTRGSSK